MDLYLTYSGEDGRLHMRGGCWISICGLSVERCGEGSEMETTDQVVVWSLLWRVPWEQGPTSHRGWHSIEYFHVCIDQGQPLDWSLQTTGKYRQQRPMTIKPQVSAAVVSETFSASMLWAPVATAASRVCTMR